MNTFEMYVQNFILVMGIKIQITNACDMFVYDTYMLFCNLNTLDKVLSLMKWV
jgi:hypothetical protein